MVSTGGSKPAVRTSRATGFSVVANESRVRTDQVKGGVKVINGGPQNLEADDKTQNRGSDSTRSSPGSGSAVKGKTCKSESSPFQIIGERSSSQLQKRKNSVALGGSNGICRSPIQSQRKKSLISASDDGDQRSAIVISNSRSDLKSSKGTEFLEVNESNRSVAVADQGKSVEEKYSGEGIGGCDVEIEKGLAQLETENPRSDEQRADEQEEALEEEDVDDGEIADHSKDGSANGYDSEENEEETMDEEIEVEKNVTYDEESAVDESITCDGKSSSFEKNISCNDEVVVENYISDCEDKEMNVTQVNDSISNCQIDSKPPEFASKPNSSSQFTSVRKQSPTFSRPTHLSPVRGSDAKQRCPETEGHSKLQNLVDLVMWKHVPRSTLVFGVGTFLIISSSYTTDINISFISVTSYLSLIYLGISFLFKSFRCSRNEMAGNDTSYCHGMTLIGEEEAICLSRLILPSLNEFLFKLRALFCGDPAVTMKLAAVLFALARCGSSITVWNMVKLGFFAGFILPKLCSSYSTQFTLYGKFWILRFQDAWRSCSHKKVVGFAMFTIVWNLSSVVARIWAAFMLFAAVRYYQQSTIKAENWDDVEVETGAMCNDSHALRRRPQEIRKVRRIRLSTTPIPSTPTDLKAAKEGS